MFNILPYIKFCLVLFRPNIYILRADFMRFMGWGGGVESLLLTFFCQCMQKSVSPLHFYNVLFSVCI